MEKCKRIPKKLMYPHGAILLLLTILSAAGLIFVFTNGLEAHPVAYVLYPVSAYTLCVLLIASPPLVRKCRDLLYGNARIARYLSQEELRSRSSLYRSTLINLGFGIFKLSIGVYLQSHWFGAVGIYYMVLCLIRFLLVQNDRKLRRIHDPEIQLRRQWRSYRVCAWLLLLLNATMSGMVFQVIWQNQSYVYPGYIIYVTAAYTFSRLTVSIVKAFKRRTVSNHVFAAARALDLSVALMAIFALQTAMFATFGAETDAGTRQLMNSLTGGAVCLAVVCIAALMLLRAKKEYGRKA